MDIGTISELGALESESHPFRPPSEDGNAVVVNGWISTLTMARIVRWVLCRLLKFILAA